MSDFIKTFDTVKMQRKGWATAVIAGDKDPLCTSSFGDANYAERLISFVEDTGDNAVLSSICDGDLAKSFGKALDTFTGACDSFPVY